MTVTTAGKKQKRVVLTIEQKLKICDLVESRSLTSVYSAGVQHTKVNLLQHREEQGKAEDISYRNQRA